MSITFYNPCLLIFAKNLKVEIEKTRINQWIRNDPGVEILFDLKTKNHYYIP